MTSCLVKSRQWLVAAVVSAIFLLLPSFVQVESLSASEIGSAENSVDGRPQATDYDAEATDISVNPAPVQASSSTISVKEENLSALGGSYQGRATFDVRFEINPPGPDNTFYWHWDEVRFIAGGS